MSNLEITQPTFIVDVESDVSDLTVTRSSVVVRSQEKVNFVEVDRTVSIDTKVSVPFQWHVVNPFPLVFRAGRVVHVRLVLDVPFNGVGATLSVGDSGNSARLMSTSQNFLAIANTYESHPLHNYLSAETINLYLALGVGNTQGSGVVILYFE